MVTNISPKEFEEPKVAGLWKLANEADFSDDKLASLNFNLKKLRSLDEDMEKSEGQKVMDKKLKMWIDHDIE